MSRRRLAFLFIFFSSVLTITLFSKSSPLYPLNDWVDANCFLTTGKAILSGQVLYREVYEQKGPVLYFLHALCALVSDASFLGVWLLEILCCTAYAWTGWKLIVRRCKSSSFLLIPGLLFLTFTTVSFASGDSAEEIALPLVAFSFAVGMNTDWKHALPTSRQALIVGITAGLVLWIKYTLCGFYIAFAFVVLAASLAQKRYREILSLAIAFLLGILLSSLPVLFYFTFHHALPDLWTAYFINNISYYSPSAGGRSRGGRQSIIDTLAGFALENPVFLILIAAGFLYAVLKKRSEAIFLVVSLLGCLPFIALGTKPYPYYAFILAAFSMYGWVPFSLLCSRLFEKHHLLQRMACCLLSFLMGMYAFHASLNTYMLGTPKEDMPQYRFARTILETENATLLNYGFLDGGFYTAAGITPTSRFFCTLNLQLTEMNQSLSASVKRGETTYVITRGKKLSGDTPYVLIDTASGLYQSNAEAPRRFTYYLYLLQEEDN